MLKNALGATLAALAAACVAFSAQGQPAMVHKTAFDGSGPATTHAYSEARCTIFRPIELKPGRHVIIWGNGTGAMPVNYAVMLHQLASYGFVVAAANTPTAGSGQDMLGCLDWLNAENSREGSIYKGMLDLSKVGATGHSQGANGALMAGRDPRITATAPVMPALRDPAAVVAAQHSPMLLLSGTADATAPFMERQKPVFDLTPLPVVWLNLRDADHFVPMRDSGPYRPAVTAWFLYQLEGDPAAAAMFTGPACGYCTDSDWIVQRKSVS